MITLEKTKEIIAKEKGFESWQQLFENRSSVYQLEKHMNEVSERYVTQAISSRVNNIHKKIYMEDVFFEKLNVKDLELLRTTILLP